MHSCETFLVGRKPGNPRPAPALTDASMRRLATLDLLDIRTRGLVAISWEPRFYSERIENRGDFVDIIQELLSSRWQ